MTRDFDSLFFTGPIFVDYSFTARHLESFVSSFPPQVSHAMSSASTPTAPYLEDLVRNSLDQTLPWVVQKYGGTSVGKSLDNITKIVGYVLTACIHRILIKPYLQVIYRQWL